MYGRIKSTKLLHNVADYEVDHHDMWKEVLEAEPGSLEEEGAAKKLANFYLLKNSEKIQHDGRDKALWSERYTEASESLYGNINREVAGALITGELSIIMQTAVRPEHEGVKQEVIDVLKSVLGPEAETNAEASGLSRERLEGITNALFESSKEIIDPIASLEHEGPFHPTQVREIFKGIVEQLSAQDDLWSMWTVENGDGSQLKINAKERKIIVPDGRSPIESKEELLALAMHEIGVHARRSVNGERVDESLRNGLSGYLDFEEGTGIFVEYLITGQLPTKAVDRYVDIALAQGMGGGLSREQLIDLAVKRENIRTSIKGGDEQKIEADAKTHVNRIFRGGDGRQHKDSEGAISQAVFVKDMVYFAGFRIVADYFNEQMDRGRTAEEVLSYILSGKFDPTNQRHEEYISQNS